MSIVTRQALRVYTALLHLRQQKGDVLDALIPFFEPILEKFDGRLFDPAVFASGVKHLYGWRFTASVSEQFVPRLEAKGFVERVSQGVYLVRFKPQQAAPNTHPELLQVISQIVSEFADYPARLSDLFHFTRSRDQLEDILIRFIVSLDAYTEDALRLQIRQLRIDDKDQALISTLEEGGRPLSQEEKYLAARFVKQLLATKPEYVPYLARLAGIGLLTEVVEDFVKPVGRVEQSNLVVFVDAPVAQHYLGLSGVSIKNDVKNVLDSLRKIGCQLQIFPESCREISRNLTSMLALPRPKRHGYTHYAMVNNEVEEQYVIAVRNNPERALEGAGFNVKQLTLQQYPGQHHFFSKERHEDFLSQIRWVQEIAPREHDATCLTLVMRLREGRHNGDLFRCRYVFVTSNPQFARVARDYCLDSRLVDERHYGPVVHLRELATLAWLRTGLDAGEVIPRGHLVAVCEQVLRVRSEVTAAVHQKLAEVTPDKLSQYELLLSDSRSVRALMDQTLGDETLVTADNAPQLLEVMRKATAAEVSVGYEKKLKDQSKRYKQEAEAIREEAAAKQAAKDQELAAEKEQSARLRNTTESFEKEQSDRLDELIRSNNKIVRFTEALLVVGVTIPCGIAALSDILPNQRGVVITGALIVFGVLSGYPLVQGLRRKPIFGIGSVLDKLGSWLLTQRGSKRISGKYFVAEIQKISFMNGIAVRNSGGVHSSVD